MARTAWETVKRVATPAGDKPIITFTREDSRRCGLVMRGGLYGALGVGYAFRKEQGFGILCQARWRQCPFYEFSPLSVLRTAIINGMMIFSNPTE